jgi:L-lactate dehydrogenase complex protein LldE
MEPQTPIARPDTVYYFGTCLVDLFYPGAGMAGMDLLRREGIRVVFPQGQSCCGQPAYNSGYPDEARRVAPRSWRSRRTGRSSCRRAPAPA